MTTGETSAEAMLAARIGLDPRTVGAPAIARALQARMLALGVRDRDAYLRKLAGSKVEQQELIEEVVIPESWFFRDERPFATLREVVAARRDGDPPSSLPPLRILSVPCACGEEPYSIAITLLDLGFTPGQFRIDAVDVSARHLAIAERATYRPNSFRGTDLSFRDRYFHAVAPTRSFTLDPSVRATVRFTLGNLLDPSLLGGEAPYDVIFCRNLLIYLDADSRRGVLANLDRLLGRTGLLFVGHAERLTVDDPRFVLWGENASFALCRASVREGRPIHERKSDPAPGRADPGRARHRPGRNPTGPGPPAPRVQPPSPRDRSNDRSAPRPTEAGPASPSPSVRADLPESAATLLDRAAALADRGRNDEASMDCEAAIERFGPSARAYFLLGLIRQVGGRVVEAEECFRKTIYLDPGHDEALLALALLAQRRGDPAAAAGYRRRADRARAKKGTA